MRSEVRLTLTLTAPGRQWLVVDDVKGLAEGRVRMLHQAHDDAGHEVYRGHLDLPVHVRCDAVLGAGRQQK